MVKRKKHLLIGIGSTIIVIVIAIILGKEVINSNTYTVQRGEFEQVITCKGEMKSQVYTKINLPDVMADPDLQIYHLKINDLVEEGTKVKKGDYVGLLDQERIKGELNRSIERLENYKNELNMRQIDSTSSLTDARNYIQELKYALEYQKIEITQSIYESKSFQEKTKRAYDRSVRKLEMEIRDYQRDQMRHAARCSYSEQQVSEYSKRIQKLQEAVIEARITAPEDGMIIYATSRGRSRKKGDMVSFWSPEIAVLPDLSKLVSESYVEEVDIAKVKKGANVRIVVDALPDKKFTGKIISIANIGSKAQGVESKVFDITIKIDGSDKSIAHGMSTSNEIITYYEPNALVIPLDYIFLADSSAYIYKQMKGEIAPCQITIAYTNDDMAMVVDGVEEGDVILKENPNKQH